MTKASSSVVTESSKSARYALPILVVCVIVLLLVWLVAPTMGQVILLGVIEGLTEFLPISSTGHLLIASKLLHFENDIGGTFEIFIQVGAILAVIGYYARDLLSQAQAFPTSFATRRFWLSIVVAFVPAALVGLLLRDWIKTVLFESPSLIAWALIVGGVVLVASERLFKPTDTTRELEQVSLVQALGIGVAQILALIPGVSRSASTIVGARLMGLDRPTATAFSFYLAIPTLCAATLVDLLGSIHLITASDLGRLLLGALVAMIVAWISIGWLLRYIAHHSFVTFGVYRIVAGVVILVLVALHVI